MESTEISQEMMIYLTKRLNKNIVDSVITPMLTYDMKVTIRVEYKLSDDDYREMDIESVNHLCENLIKPTINEFLFPNHKKEFVVVYDKQYYFGAHVTLFTYEEELTEFVKKLKNQKSSSTFSLDILPKSTVAWNCSSNIVELTNVAVPRINYFCDLVCADLDARRCIPRDMKYVTFLKFINKLLKNIHSPKIADIYDFVYPRDNIKSNTLQTDENIKAYKTVESELFRYFKSFDTTTCNILDIMENLCKQLNVVLTPTYVYYYITGYYFYADK